MSSSRAELIERAQTFLRSAPVQQQDEAAKRSFLTQKGLTDSEIDLLLAQERPVVPPRTYPPPAPSKLPNIVVGILRLSSWLVGVSAVVFLFYQRFLLPRITQSGIARASIQSHHAQLFKRFGESLKSFKETHDETMSVLPHPVPYKEPSPYPQYSTVSEVLNATQDKDIPLNEVPPLTLLRCAIHDWATGHQQQHPSTQELFQLLEGQIPWLATEDGVAYEERLWATLNDCPYFQQSDAASNDPSVMKNMRWAYQTPPPTPDPEIVSSLSKLATTLSTSGEGVSTSRRHTLKALTDFTGYISSQVYSSSYRSFSAGSGNLTPQQDEVRREIRALKGLVLNRRSFFAK